MKITLKIKRFDPESDHSPRFKTYEVEVNPTDRLLDALMIVFGLFFNPMDQPARVAQPERMMGLAAYIERKVPGIADRHVVLDFAYLYGGMSLLWGWHETWAPQRLQQFQMLEKLRNQALEQHH